MSIDPNIFFEPRTVGEALAGAPTEEVRSAILLFFADLTKCSYADPEHLQFNGLFVGRAGHAGLDTDLLAWIEAQPSDRRIDIASWFLYGYWGAVPMGSLALCHLLFDIADRVEVVSLANQGVFFALSSAYYYSSLLPEDKARIKEVLVRHLDNFRRIGAWGIVGMFAEIP